MFDAGGGRRRARWRQQRLLSCVCSGGTGERDGLSGVAAPAACGGGWRRPPAEPLLGCGRRRWRRAAAAGRRRRQRGGRSVTAVGFRVGGRPACRAASVPETGNFWGQREVCEGGGWWPAVGVVSGGGAWQQGRPSAGVAGRGVDRMRVWGTLSEFQGNRRVF